MPYPDTTKYTDLAAKLDDVVQAHQDMHGAIYEDALAEHDIRQQGRDQRDSEHVLSTSTVSEYG